MSELTGKALLDAHFGSRPLNVDLVKVALKGALDIMIRPAEGRVSVLKQGQRVDTQLVDRAATEVIRAWQENALAPLLPMRGRSQNSANVRVFRSRN